MHRALDDGEIAAVAAAHMGIDSQYRIVAQFSPLSLYIALPKDRTELAVELDQAMDRLSMRELSFSAALHDRYLGTNTDLDPVFTDDEYAYLATAPVLRVAYDASRAPLSYTDPETGTFAGVTALLFGDISRITGLQFEFVPVERHGDMFQLAVTGGADVVADVAQSDDDAARGLVGTTGPYLRDPMTLITGAYPDGTRIALLSGTLLSVELAGMHGGDDIVFFDTSKQCIDAVLSGTSMQRMSTPMWRTICCPSLSTYPSAQPPFPTLSAT